MPDGAIRMTSGFGQPASLRHHIGQKKWKGQRKTAQYMDSDRVPLLRRLLNAVREKP